VRPYNRSIDPAAESRYAREQAFHDRVFEQHSRQALAPYYSVVRASRVLYEHLLSAHGAGKDVLEYGCGPGSYAFFLAERGASVLGIDLSATAIEQARAAARERAADGVEFRQLNAESLELADASFDLVCGTGILHHLDLDRAYSEIVRTLRPDGTAVFIEPLGHNPLINRFRRRTPSLRTEDEHPLRLEDLELARRYFDRVEWHPFHLLSLAAVPLRRLPGFGAIVGGLDAADRLLFRLAPPLEKHAWQAVLVLEGPRA
jgi:SAM-dependent methyltransferase